MIPVPTNSTVTEKPKFPIVYMADYPAGAFVTGTGVRNAALEFQHLHL